MEERKRLFALALYAEHLEEAAGFYDQRQAALDDPFIFWKDLDHFDNSIEAHIDALTVGGRLAQEVYQREIEECEPGEYYVSLVLLCRQNCLETVTATLASQDPNDIPKVKAARDALHHSVHPGQEDPWIEALKIHPNCGAILPEFLARRRIVKHVPYLHCLLETTKDPETAAQAAWALGRIGTAESCAALWDTFRSSKVPRLREATLLALLRLGDQRAYPEIANGVSEGSVPLTFLSLCAGPNDVGSIFELARSAKQSFRMEALGLLGDPRAVNFLIECLEDDECSRAAAQSLRLILGADLWEQILIHDETDEEDLDQDIAPPPERIKRLSQNPDQWNSWWSDHHTNFLMDRRYRLSELYSPSALVSCLHGDYPRLIRQLAGEELVVRYRQDYQFETNLPVVEQQRSVDLYNDWASHVGSGFELSGWYLAGKERP